MSFSQLVKSGALNRPHLRHERDRGRKRRSSRRVTDGRPLLFESLEDRRLLSGSSSGHVYAYWISGWWGAQGAYEAYDWLKKQDRGGKDPDSVVQQSYWNCIGQDCPTDICYYPPGPGVAVPAAIDLAYHLRRDPQDLVIVVGYSLGGETALMAANMAANWGYEIDILALIDPVSSNYPGFRAPLQDYTLSPNIKYVFNRWQTNYPWPIDTGSSARVGIADSSMTYSDQEKQNDMLRYDGSKKYRGCTATDYLLGYCKCNLFECDKDTSRTDHGRIGEDDGIEQELVNIIDAHLQSLPELHLTGSGADASGGLGLTYASESDGAAQVYSWDIAGYANSVDLDVYKNGQRIDQQHYEGHSGVYGFDHLGIGDYRFDASINAFNPRSTSTTISVYDDDRSPPNIQISGPSGTMTDATIRNFSWDVSDPSGLSQVSVVLRGPAGQLTSDSWKNGGAPASGSFDFTTFGLGTFEIEIKSTDNDNDWAGDRSSATKKQRVTVIDDDDQPPEIRFSLHDGTPLVGSGFRQSHGLTNAVRWNIADPKSGISNVDVTIRRDGTVLRSYQAEAVDAALLDEDGLGVFEVEVRATDLDGDGWLGDPATRVATAMLEVTNAPPEVFSGGPYVLVEGGLLQLKAVGSDPDPGDTEQLIYEWDLNADGLFGDVAGAQVAILFDQLEEFGIADDGNFPIAVRVTDRPGAVATAPTTLTILNAAPQVECIHADSSVEEGGTVTVTGRYTDPGAADTHEVLVSWGDGASTPAAVDAATRTFTASHVYSDDDPTDTQYDDYIIQVVVTDDDGDHNPPRLQTVTVETERVGGIELPAFNASLPAGVSGLLTQANVQVDPLPTSTNTAAGQTFSHSHTVNYPQSGPFNLSAKTTNSVSGVGNHRHTFDLPAATKTFTSSTDLTNYFKQSSDKKYAMGSINTGGSGLPIDHTHSSGDVKFTTTTTFTYTPPRPKTVLNTTFWSMPGNVDLYGSAYHDGDHYVMLTDNYSQTGSLLVDTTNEAIKAFEATFSLWIGGGDHADGFSFGYGPIPNGAVFGEDGYGSKPGLWVTFDTYDNGSPDLVGIEVWYNGSRRDYYYWTPTSYSVSRLATGQWEPVTISMSSAGYLTMRHSFFETGERTIYVSGWSPSSSWRFGAGARTGGAWDYHAVDTMKILDYTQRSYTTTVTKTATNEYVLPKFNSSLGTLTKAVVTLDAALEYTTYKDGGQFPHTHDVSLTVSPFAFGAGNVTSASAAATHQHTVDFQPVSLDIASPADLEQYFLQTGNVVLAQPARTLTTSLSHNHTLAANSVPFHARTVFTYDVTSTVVRVNNIAPQITDYQVTPEIAEGGTVHVSGSFSDPGERDTHRVRVDWADGTMDELAIEPGGRDFAASHQYLDDRPSGTSWDMYPVRVTVLDDDRGTATAVADVIVRNLPPVLTVTDAASVGEGGVFTLPMSVFSDIGVLDTHTATISWGDNTTAAGLVTETAGQGVIRAEHVYANDGEYELVVTLRDDDGAVDSRTITARVDNLPPRIDSVAGNLVGSEGSSLRLSVLASDPGNDPLTYTWDFGDGSPLVTGPAADRVEHTYADEGTYTVRVSVADDLGAEVEETLTVAISDVAASALLAGPAMTDEGSTYAFSLGAVVDPGNDPIVDYAVDWGDGTVEHYVEPGVKHHVYGQGPGDFTITVVLVDDEFTETVAGQLPVHVRNVAPTVTSFTGPATGWEGSPLTFVAVASDPGDDITRYLWDFGDGSIPASGSDLDEVTHTYPDDGVYFLQLTVEDRDGGVASHRWPVVVANVSPVLTVAGDESAAEGAEYSLLLGTLHDPGDDTVAAYLVHWGDGTTDTYDAAGVVHHVYRDGPAQHTVRVSVRDEDGIHPDLAAVTVAVDNRAPVINALGGAVSGREGERVKLTADVTDPAGAADLLVFTWDFGDGTPLVRGLNLDEVYHTYADDGVYTLSLVVVDDDGAETRREREVVVANVAPTIVVSGPPVIDEGRTYTLDFGIITDPGKDAVSQWIVHWGDGTHGTYFQPLNAVHIYPDGPESFTIRVELIDEDGSHADAGALDVSVRNVPPAITMLEGMLDGEEGELLTFTALAADSGGANDPLTYVWNFGDGSPVQEGIDLVSVEHAYDDGQYVISLTVHDGDGGYVERSLPLIVRNVAPGIALVGQSATMEGSSYQLVLGPITDPGDDTVTAWHVDWGDGLSDEYSAGGAVEHIYGDGPSTPLINVTLADEDGVHVDVASLSVDLLNAPPEIRSVAASEIRQEGTPIIFRVEAYDAADDADTLTYTWDFGDGSTVVAGEDLGTVMHAYADDGSFSVMVTVQDEDGGQAAAQLDVEIVNVAPALEVLRPATASEASPYVLTLGDVRDPGDDTVTGWSVDWGDGTSETFVAGGELSHIYAQGPATHTISISLTDEDGIHLVQQFPLDVLNAAPEISAIEGDTEADEGGTVSIYASATDPAGDALNYEWDFGDGSDPITGQELTEVTHTFADNGFYTVTLTVTDDDDSWTHDVIEITVSNVAPTLDAGADQTVHEGQLVTLGSATFHDLGTLDTHTATIDWGDGTAVEEAVVIETPFGPPGATDGMNGTITGSHVYADDGQHTVTVTVTDDDGGTVTDSLLVTVLNVAPTIDTLPTQYGIEGDPIFLIGAAFHDLGTLDTHTATIDWGDGTPIEQAVVTETPFGPPGSTDGMSGTIGGSHVYADGGIYTVTVTLQDDDQAATDAVAASTQAIVTGAGILDGVLQIVGTPGDDQVSLNQQGTGTIKVHADFLPGGPFKSFPVAAVNQISAWLFDGDDHLTIAGNIAIPALLDAGEGDDHLNSGAGATLLLGGSGSDTLNGGSGRDILVGGSGTDRLVGGSGEDVLIGGTASDESALRAALAAWTDALASYEDRAAAIASLLAVADDEEEDLLTGSAGRDLFFTGLGDVLNDAGGKRDTETIL